MLTGPPSDPGAQPGVEVTDPVEVVLESLAGDVETEALEAVGEHPRPDEARLGPVRVVDLGVVVLVRLLVVPVSGAAGGGPLRVVGQEVDGRDRAFGGRPGEAGRGLEVQCRPAGVAVLRLESL